jgi:uncharacterized protein YerC
MIYLTKEEVKEIDEVVKVRRMLCEFMTENRIPKSVGMSALISMVVMQTYNAGHGMPELEQMFQAMRQYMRGIEENDQ